jgi:hypothetical protein
MDTFDVAIVATLRPELLKRTLTSFIDNLWGKAYWTTIAKFYVNVDLAGAPNEREVEPLRMKVQEILFRILGKENVVINYKQPHFPTAWLWGIQNTTSNLVFHLEEDWVMDYKIDFEKMYGMFVKYKRLKHLRLSFFKSTEEYVRLWGKYNANWNGDFFNIEDSDIIPVGWCGHPSLNDGKWLRKVAEKIDPGMNPEKQFHRNQTIVDEFIKGNQFGVFQPQNTDRTLTDIGREWMKANGFVKSGGINPEWFTHWVRKEG